MEISLQAGELVGVLYDALLKQYAEPESEETLKSLNALCVRLVFCLYAEDAGIFGKRGMFHDYLRAHRAEDRRALINLFRVLDQKPENRDRYLDEDLAAFPYVNGGLFADENIEIPRLGDEIIDLLLTKASEDFDWSAISPTIFGAVFESTLNPETRRSGGMHYTSIENIHKVIDPLFLDDLKAEFEEIKSVTVTKTREAKLRAFQNKLASLKFLDPACGSGNFLTETYLSLRRLENKDAVIKIEITLNDSTDKLDENIISSEQFEYTVSADIHKFLEASRSLKLEILGRTRALLYEAYGARLRREIRPTVESLNEAHLRPYVYIRFANKKFLSIRGEEIEFISGDFFGTLLFEVSAIEEAERSWMMYLLEIFQEKIA